MSEQYQKEKKDLLQMKYRNYINRFPKYTHEFFYYYDLKNASPKTIMEYAKDIDTFFSFLVENNPTIHSYADITLDVLDMLTSEDIQAYMTYLLRYQKNEHIHKNKEIGRARKLTTLRSFYKYYQSVTKAINNNPAAAYPLPKIQTKDVIAMTYDEIQLLLDEIYQSEHSDNYTKHQKAYMKKAFKRDLALIVLLLGTGIRVSECADIDIDDIDRRDNSIRIFRKGGKESQVFFGENVAEILDDYIEHGRKPKDINEKALFISDRGTRISTRTIERLVKKYTKNTIKSKTITPHKLRSSYATQLYNQTRDPMLVKEALGHQNISVVQKYIKADESYRKEAAQISDSFVEQK